MVINVLGVLVDLVAEFWRAGYWKQPKILAEQFFHKWGVEVTREATCILWQLIFIDDFDFFPQVCQIQEILHRVLYQILSIDLDLNKSLCEILSILIDLMSEPD